NALLQERGKKSVGAGNAIAVQNLGENSAMLLMLGLYSLAVLVVLDPVLKGEYPADLVALLKTYDQLPACQPGDRQLIADGKIDLL
ncbi:hypothetical protein MJI69_29855, partial [Salmonella enterica subsp. enterica serovar Anatum]|nr:hypothetical protein [Salmonella enterica subsp. enterica serovar Anatum]